MSTQQRIEHLERAFGRCSALCRNRPERVRVAPVIYIPDNGRNGPLPALHVQPAETSNDAGEPCPAGGWQPELDTTGGVVIYTAGADGAQGPQEESTIESSLHVRS